jgi:hypothetical protein
MRYEYISSWGYKWYHIPIPPAHARNPYNLWLGPLGGLLHSAGNHGAFSGSDCFLGDEGEWHEKNLYLVFHSEVLKWDSTTELNVRQRWMKIGFISFMCCQRPACPQNVKLTNTLEELQSWMWNQEPLTVVRLCGHLLLIKTLRSFSSLSILEKSRMIERNKEMLLTWGLRSQQVPVFA